MSTFPGFFQELGEHVRADRFTGEAAFYNLLTHSHSDHMQGLQRVKGFRGHLICTSVTARWVSKLEGAQDRAKMDAGLIEKPVRPFQATLNTTQLSKLDHLEQTVLQLPGFAGSVKVTALDANHCPGSCMFLFEHFSSARCNDSTFQRALLYTGDIRADPEWLQALRQMEPLKPYLADPKSIRRLDKIYLDTSAVLDDSTILPIDEAINRTLHLMETWPAHARFFLNAWTSGYERLLIAVAMHFDTPIHIDRWKHALYRCYLSQQTMLRCFTLDATSTRFHACQRQFKCDTVWNNGRGCFAFSPLEQQNIFRNTLKRSSPALKSKLNVGCGCSAQDAAACLGEACTRQALDEELLVYVNPAEPFKRQRYDGYEKDLYQRLAACKEEAFRRSTSRKVVHQPLIWPDHLLVPFSRHSTLPELRSFVALFEPCSLYPNTIKDQERLTDYFLLATIFKSALAAGAPERILKEATEELHRLNSQRSQQFAPPPLSALAELGHRFGDGSDLFREVSDVAMLNLEGSAEAELEARHVLGLHEAWQPGGSDVELCLADDADDDSQGEDESSTTDRHLIGSFKATVAHQSNSSVDCFRSSELFKLFNAFGATVEGPTRTLQASAPFLEREPAVKPTRLPFHVQPSASSHGVPPDQLSKERRALVRKTRQQKRQMQSDVDLQVKMHQGLCTWKRLRSEAQESRKGTDTGFTPSDEPSSFRIVGSSL